MSSKNLLSIRPGYLILIASLVMLAGCQTYQNAQGEAGKPAVVKDPKELLDAEEGKMKSDLDREYSPIEQHMKARRDVDPTKINRKNKFSKTVDDYEVADKENFRVVRVDEDVSSIDKEMKAKGLKIEADPLKRQKDAKSYVQRVLAKHEASQSGSSQPKETDISVSQSTVKNVRVGQHPGKTRIVLDVSGKTSFQTRLENSNKTLVITLPSATWGAKSKTKANGGSLVKGYDASNSGSGSVLKIALGEPGRLAYQKAMKPSGKYGHRIVLDVVAR